MEFKKQLKRYSHLRMVLLFIPLLIWFSYIERSMVPKYVMHAKLDDYIPFVPIFIIPYLSWFIYIGFGFLYSAVKSKKEFYRLCIFIFGGMTISYIIYMLFPNGQNLRPKSLGNDIFSQIIGLIYKIDTPTNVLPSIHIMDSIALNTAIINCAERDKNKRMEYISAIWMILICVSTLLVKQHSILDVAAGAVLSACLYVFIYVLPCKIHLHVKTQASEVKSH